MKLLKPIYVNEAIIISTQIQEMNSLVLVQGGTHPEIGPVLAGTYSKTQHQHHGKPIYQKAEQCKGVDLFCYFEDGSGGQEYLGWWFGMEVGAMETWAFNPGPKEKPPRTGWKVPYTGDVDTTMVLSGCGIGICLQCQEKASDDCDNEMCNQHCGRLDRYCNRHKSEWQLWQNSLRRGERAKRRRGGGGKGGVE